MGPAQRLGLFLGTWRAQWARLSRAQLALAVGAHTGKPQNTTAAVIRRWETGQPPKSLEELDALGLVMRRHGLSAPEVAQFRDAVLAACVDRHYPGLFGDGDFASRPDCDHLAYEALDTEWHLQMGGTNTVTLVAWCYELRRATAERLRPACGNRQERRQDLALVWVLHALAKNHYARGRVQESLRLAQECLHLMETRLRSDAGALCSEHVLQWHMATNLSCLGRHREALARFLAQAEERRAAGDRRWACASLSWAIYPACATGSQGVLQLLRGHEPNLIAYADEQGDEYLHGLTHRAQFGLDLAQGHLAEAQARLEKEILPCRPTPDAEMADDMCCAHLASARGNHAEAQLHLEKSLGLADVLGLEGTAREVRGKLDACERAQHELHRRRRGDVLTRQAPGSGRTG